MPTIAIHEVSTSCPSVPSNVAASRRAAVATVVCTRPAAVPATAMAAAMKRTDKRTTAAAVRITRSTAEPPGE